MLKYKNDALIIGKAAADESTENVHVSTTHDLISCFNRWEEESV